MAREQHRPQENPQENLPPHGRPISARLHPVVYLCMAGSAAWFVAAAWISLGGGGGYADFLLTVVTGFFLMVAAIPFLLWLTWERQGRDDAANASFREWAAGELEVLQERRPAIGAAFEALLPMGAAAVGMTGLGLIFHFVAASVAS